MMPSTVPSHEQRRSNAAATWENYQIEEGVYSRRQSSDLAKLGKSGMSRTSPAYQTRESQIQSEYDTSMEDLKGSRSFKELQDFYVSDISRTQMLDYRKELVRKASLPEEEGGNAGNIDWDRNIQAEVLKGFAEKVDLGGMDDYYKNLYGDTTIREERQFTTDERGTVKSTSPKEARRAPTASTPLESEWI